MHMCMTLKSTSVFQPMMKNNDIAIGDGECMTDSLDGSDCGYFGLSWTVIRVYCFIVTCTGFTVKQLLTST